MSAQTNDYSGLIEDAGLAMVDTRYDIEEIAEEADEARLKEAKWVALTLVIVLVAAFSAHLLAGIGRAA